MLLSSGPEFPFLFRPENIARYEDGEVFILDRRVFPFKREFVRCPTYEDTARAVEDMVTQSGGPRFAVGYGMVQAAFAARDLKKEAKQEAMEKAAERLIHTRSTQNMIRDQVLYMLDFVFPALEEGRDLEQVMLEAVNKTFERRDQVGLALGEHAASMLKDGDVILNHCWAESGIIYTVYCALQKGLKLEAICSETRPYLQGARLTADALAEMGLPTKVVTDGMPAMLMSQGKISVFMTGADRVTMDGHVINKIGTLSHAIAAFHFGVPYYPFCFGPDPEAPTPAEVEIEYRDPEEVTHCLTMRTATEKAQGLYPAFDITPPRFVSAVITDRGVMSPYALEQYYEEGAGPQRGMIG